MFLFGRRGDLLEEMFLVEIVKCIDGLFWILDVNKGELIRFEFVLDRDLFLCVEVIFFDKDSILCVFDFVVFNDMIFLIFDYLGDS